MRDDIKCVKIVMIVCLCAILHLTGCSMLRAGSGQHYVDSQSADADPSASGVVQMVWEEPMVDVIDVPPGLDPEGHYYRPAHQAVVEIRQGRWKQAEK